MEDAPKISVIVPAYNVERYLGLCIESILDQKFKDFELIIVDNCSTDSTFEIAKSFSDSRIRLLKNEKHLEYPGLNRNVALTFAQGKYVYFCDSDDVILPEALEVLVRTAEENSADVVNTTKWYVSATPDFHSLKNLPVKFVKFPDALPVSPDLKTRIYQEFVQSRMHITPWLFLYRRKFLLENNIKFVAEVAEDVFFNFDVVCATSKIVKIDFFYYVYRDHATSVTKDPSRIRRNINSIINFNKRVDEKLSKINDPDFVRLIQGYWMRHLSGTYIVPFFKNNPNEVMEKILETLTPRFGNDSSFVLTLLQLYAKEFESIQKNSALMTTIKQLNAENLQLKETLKNIVNQVNAVLKV